MSVAKSRANAPPRVIFVDTAEILNNDRAGGFVDGMHFSDKGARIIAQVLFKNVQGILTGHDVP